jgi:hypothetical protein
MMYQTDSVSALKGTTRTFQTDLWGKGIPFVRSQLVHNQTVSIFNQFFRNVTEFLYVPNFYQTLLLANMYLIFLGMIEVGKSQTKDIKIVTWVILGIFLAVVGAALHAGKSSSIFPLIPVVIYLGGCGASKSKLPIYVGLLVTQVLFMGWG